jgi:hypothetical protein
MTNTNTRELHYTNAFFVTGEAGAEDDGGNDGVTIYAATWERLHQINPGVAQAAATRGFTKCGFTTTYGDLIAVTAPGVHELDSTEWRQCAVYANGTWDLA